MIFAWLKYEILTFEIQWKKKKEEEGQKLKRRGKFGGNSRGGRGAEGQVLGLGFGAATKKCGHKTRSVPNQQCNFINKFY